MPITLQEISNRAHAFSREWKHAESEDADAKSFWDAFFEVFGVARRRVASFEKRVKKIDGKDGYAQGVLDARGAEFRRDPAVSLATVYDPELMPPALLKAHQALDRAVDAAYVPDGGKRKWGSDAERVAFLFRRYRELTSLLPGEESASRSKVSRRHGSGG